MRIQGEGGVTRGWTDNIERGVCTWNFDAAGVELVLRSYWRWRLILGG